MYVACRSHYGKSLVVNVIAEDCRCTLASITSTQSLIHQGGSLGPDAAGSAKKKPKKTKQSRSVCQWEVALMGCGCDDITGVHG